MGSFFPSSRHYCFGLPLAGKFIENSAKKIPGILWSNHEHRHERSYLVQRCFWKYTPIIFDVSLHTVCFDHACQIPIVHRGLSLMWKHQLDLLKFGGKGKWQNAYPDLLQIEYIIKAPTKTHVQLGHTD